MKPAICVDSHNTGPADSSHVPYAGKVQFPPLPSGRSRRRSRTRRGRRGRLGVWRSTGAVTGWPTGLLAILITRVTTGWMVLGIRVLASNFYRLYVIGHT